MGAKSKMLLSERLILINFDSYAQLCPQLRQLKQTKLQSLIFLIIHSKNLCATYTFYLLGYAPKLPAYGVKFL